MEEIIKIIVEEPILWPIPLLLIAAIIAAISDYIEDKLT